MWETRTALESYLKTYLNNLKFKILKPLTVLKFILLITALFKNYTLDNKFIYLKVRPIPVLFVKYVGGIFGACEKGGFGILQIHYVYYYYIGHGP